MENQHLAMKIKDLRNRRGFSQEQLSEESKLSLRTIQRIEKGESEPRGDTLVKLTQALGVTPDDLLEFAAIEDKSYLSLLNLSALSIVIQPLLGVIIPLVMWILKREKIKHVEDTGKKLINFQITWALFFYLIFTVTAMMGGHGVLSFNFFSSFLSFLRLSIPGILLFTMYLYNIILIFVNIRRSQKEKKSKYFPAISFLK